MKNQTKTKIVATIGPASHTQAMLVKMIKAGMRVARLNFSHGTHADHAKLIKNIRTAAKKAGTEIAILQDLQGPRIRIGDVPEEGVQAKRGGKVALVGDFHSMLRIPGYEIVPIQYKNLYKDVKKGTLILIEDGTIQLKVTQVKNKIIYTKVKVAGVIKTHKGINVPGATLTVDVITEKDKKDLVFGQKHDVDYVALSFVKEAKDIKRLKAMIAKEQKKSTTIATKVIAKIERREALENLEGILDEVDGVMVARGDLGIELPAEQVPLLQKDLIARCLRRGKPVIVATQMLDSMIRNPLPTRAEVSDVANAVIDHTDGIMLSGESATGKYPVEAIKMMTKIATVTENSHYDDYDCGPYQMGGRKPALAQAACQLYDEIDAKAAIVLTATGDSARLLSRHRPEMLIYAITPELKTQRQLALSWGVMAQKVTGKAAMKTILTKAIADLQKMRIVKKGDAVIIAGSDPFGEIPEMHMVQVIHVGEKL